ncbi:MAG: DUF488 family protein [Steroidobacteraceae bacterium]
MFFTICHTTRTLEEFVDVRSMPKTRTNSQFNLETLPVELAQRQVGYEHIVELGGFRGMRRVPRHPSMPIGGFVAFEIMQTTL